MLDLCLHIYVYIHIHVCVGANIYVPVSRLLIVQTYICFGCVGWVDCVTVDVQYLLGLVVSKRRSSQHTIFHYLFILCANKVILNCEDGVYSLSSGKWRDLLLPAHRRGRMEGERGPLMAWLSTFTSSTKLRAK